MKMEAPLSSESKKALRILVNKRMLRGGELMEAAGIKDLNGLKNALQPLLDQSIIAATDPVEESGGYLNSRFYVLPSYMGSAMKMAVE
jgi:hypothetical protein